MIQTRGPADAPYGIVHHDVESFQTARQKLLAEGSPKEIRRQAYVAARYIEAVAVDEELTPESDTVNNCTDLLVSLAGVVATHREEALKTLATASG